jgi:hypothetical protein
MLLSGPAKEEHEAAIAVHGVLFFTLLLQLLLLLLLLLLLNVGAGCCQGADL